MIILILFSSNKIVISLSYEDQTLLLLYIIISNLDLKTRYRETWLSTLLLQSISVIHKQSEDTDNKNKDLKAKIYHLALKTIL